MSALASNNSTAAEKFNVHVTLSCFRPQPERNADKSDASEGLSDKWLKNEMTIFDTFLNKWDIGTEREL